MVVPRDLYGLVQEIKLKVFAEYLFINEFRNNPKFSDRVYIENKDNLEKIRKSSRPVIFVSGHFSNFELMAMSIEKSGINLEWEIIRIGNEIENELNHE